MKHQIVIWAQTKLLMDTYVWPVKAYREASSIREVAAHQELPLNFWCIYTQTVRLVAGKPSEHFNDIYNNIGIKIFKKINENTCCTRGKTWYNEHTNQGNNDLN